MANEVTVSTTLKYAKGSVAASLSGSYKANQSGSFYVSAVQSIGTSEEQVAKGDIGTIGYCMFKNVDTTNFVRLGSATGSYSIKLRAGESTGAIPWNGTTVYAIADTAAVNLDYMLIEL